jgi:prephenate dehydrogenase
VERVVIVGTGLIGSSIGLALRGAGFAGRIDGVDVSREERAQALAMGAVDDASANLEEAGDAVAAADVIVLAVPVLAILDAMQRLGPMLRPQQLVTDVGSTKLKIAELARDQFNRAGRARFLPGHPMAGKESGGAGLGEAALLEGATWLFTPIDATAAPLEAAWRGWVARFGCRVLDLDAARHDVVCAWVSHLPQMVSTAMAALLEEDAAADFLAIGGRALREMTRLGASPYSMWRDVAMTNTAEIAATLHALEQRLQHVRENLRTPELKEEFRLGNRFRARR